MINPRKVSTLGIGFGAIAIATIGLLPYTTPPVEVPCGDICSSVIVGHYQLGCTPLTGKFDLTCTYELPPIPPTPGGGGGSYVGTNWGNLRHITPKTKECIQKVDIIVHFNDGISFNQHYNINVCNTTKRAKVKIVNDTNIPTITAKVSATFVKPATPIVMASFVNNDK